MEKKGRREVVGEYYVRVAVIFLPELELPFYRIGTKIYNSFERKQGLNLGLVEGKGLGSPISANFLRKLNRSFNIELICFPIMFRNDTQTNWKLAFVM